MLTDKYGMEALHAKLLVLLKDFDKYCVDHGVEYSLIYGSMLGAVREKGFIPWDDDLDIGMDRGNYEKLLKALEFDKLPDPYVVIRPLWLTKICYPDEESGIDLFVFDHVPDGRAGAFLKKYSVLMLQGMIKPSLSREGNKGQQTLSFITWLFGKLFTGAAKQRMFERISRMSNNKDTKMVAIFNGVFKYVRTKQYSADLLDGIVRMDFEDMQAPVYKNYDLFLVETYGDYMQVPPENERVPSHLGPEGR